MISIIDSLFYRLKHTKSFYIILAVAFAMPLFGCLLMYGMFSIEGLESITDVLRQEMNVEAFLPQNASVSSDASVLSLVALAIFFGREFGDGTVRNAVTAGKKRGEIYWSYFIVGFVIVAAINTASMFSTVLSFGTAFGFGDSSAAVSAVNVVVYYGLTIFVSLLTLTMSLFFLFISKKTSMTIVFPLLIVTFVPTIVTLITGVSSFAQQVGAGISKEAMEWIPFLQNVLLVGQAPNAGLILKTMLMTFIMAGLFGGFGYLAFNKSDLK